MKKIKSVAGIKDPYVKRILSNIIDKDALKVYSQTPGILKRFTNGLTETQLYKPLVKGKWSIAQIIAHLCDSELVMGFRYRMAIAQPRSPLQAFDENRWAKRLRYDSANWKKKLEVLTEMRQDHIALLRSLTSNEWKQYGIHAERGKETVERMVQMTAGHDINHLRQIKNIRASYLNKTKR